MFDIWNEQTNEKLIIEKCAFDWSPERSKCQFDVEIRDANHSNQRYRYEFIYFCNINVRFSSR